MTPHEFETALLADHYSTLTTVIRPSGYILSEHQHPFDACALITAGDITLTVAGISRTYGAGDIFRLAAATAHLESAGPAGVTYLVGRREALTS